MKKAISFLTVLVLVLSFGIVGFADEDVAPIPGAAPQAAAQIAPRISYITGDNDTISYTVKAGEMFLVDSNGVVVGADTLLTPNTTYKFDIYYAATDITEQPSSATVSAGTKLTYAEIGRNASVKVRTIKGSGVLASTKIRTTGSSTASNSGYQLEVVTRQNYGVKITDVEFELYTTGTTAKDAFTFQPSRHTFRVGYESISEDDTDIGEGGSITISNDYPVILKDQFTDIARSANYKNVIFQSDDGNWTFTGKVAGMKDTNFTFNYDPDETLMNRFPDQEFKFLNFPAGVNFPTTGEMRINVSDVSDDFDRMYVYLHRDGKLTQISGTYDSGADEIVFRTNYLGRFVVTNKEITDTSITEEPTDDDKVPGETNPSTGVGTGMNLLAMYTLASIGAGVAIRRKRK